MSNDNKALADVQPGGRVRLGDQAALKRLHAHLTAYPPPCNPEDVAVLGAALSAQPSPGGQDTLAIVRANLRSISDLATKAGGDRVTIANINCEVTHALQLLDLAARQPVGAPEIWVSPRQLEELKRRPAGQGSNYLPTRLASEGNFTQPLYAAPPAQAVSQDWQHIANEWADAATNGVQWLRNIRDGASNVADALACMESNVERIQQLKPPAQAVDLAPDSIPNTPEVRDILGRPNFWCSPWANVLRMRGDEIPNKAEEEQAAVIRFMLNHYLANGTAWAETAGAELDAIRKVDGKAVGNG